MISNKMEVKETDMESEMVQKSITIALEAQKQYALDKVIIFFNSCVLYLNNLLQINSHFYVYFRQMSSCCHDFDNYTVTFVSIPS